MTSSALLPGVSEPPLIRATPVELPDFRIPLTLRVEPLTCEMLKFPVSLMVLTVAVGSAVMFPVTKTLLVPSVAPIVGPAGATTAPGSLWPYARTKPPAS